MSEKIWTPSYQEPTLFNKGWFLGDIAGVIPALIVGAIASAALGPAAGLFFTSITSLTARYIGGSMRKQSIVLENTHGKPASAPTYFNEGFFAGYSPVAMMTGVGMITAKIAVLAGATAVAPLIPALIVIGLGAALVAGAITAADGKHRMEREYEEATQQNLSQGITVSKALEVESPAQNKSYAAEIEMQRLLAAQQQKQL